MIIFIKKIKTKEGINSIDTDKVKKEIPAGYKPADDEPMVSLTAHNVMVAYKCIAVPQAKANPKPGPKAKARSKKTTTAKA